MTHQTATQIDAPVHEMTASDMFVSLNGFDELAITKAFGTDVADLRSKPFLFLRAMVLIAERRNGANDAEAFKSAMNLTVQTLGEYFAEDEVEIDPDDPVTAAGKDDEPSS